MCGRFTLTRPTDAVAATFDADDPPALAVSWEARFNVAPTQPVIVVRRGGDRGRSCSLARWGFAPSWSAAEKKAAPLINAMAETVTDRAAFRAAFTARRCLVPADGFYEWLVEGKKKRQPYLFALADGGLFAFAGLWQPWQAEKEGELTEAACILTTEANDVVRPVHLRMPAILPREAYDAWLDPDANVESLRKLLRPYPAAEMVGRAVSAFVNSARNEGPGCVAPAEAEPPSLF